MTAERQKISTTLFISGMALIAFGILDIIKFLVAWLVDPLQFALIQYILEEYPALGAFIIGFGAGSLAIELLLFFLIGLCARSESKGKKRSLFYVIVAIILICVLPALSITNFVYLFFETITFDLIVDGVMSLVLTGAVVFALIDIVRSSFKLRKLRKQEATQNTPAPQTKKDKEVSK